MRVLAFAPVLATLLLGACASNGLPPPGLSERDVLARECDAKGGIVVPTGTLTGQPSQEEYCRTSGGLSRIPRQP